MSERPPIPAEVAREVRQRCGFGCVLCGMPLYEYEHMLEWANVKRHVAEEMTLLCRQHHGERTDKLLPIEAVQAANADPYNRRTGISKNVFLHYSGKDLKLRVANSSFEYRGLQDGAMVAPLVIDNQPIVAFRVDQGHLLLSFTAFDEVNRPIIQVNDNELVYDAAARWDIEWVGQKLVFRDGRRRILLQLRFSPPNEISITKGRILRNGIEILIGKNYMFVTNNGMFMSNINTVNCAIGMTIGDPTPKYPFAIRMAGIPRYSIDRKAALRFLRSARRS
jgi:hypothetical protein